MRRPLWSMVLLVGLMLLLPSLASRIPAFAPGGPPLPSAHPAPRSRAAARAVPFAAPIAAGARSFAASLARAALARDAWEARGARLAALAPPAGPLGWGVALLASLMLAAGAFALGASRARARRRPERLVLRLAGRGEAHARIAARAALARDGVRLLLRPSAADARHGRG